MKIAALLMLFASTLTFAQTNKRDSIWLPLKPFLGTWKGEGGGEPGSGKYERTYQYVLNRNFIEIRNKSTYLPTDKHPKGEVHEDIGYFSYDRGAKAFMLRQFHVEGFVNEFKLDSISPDRKTIVFLTVGIENIPQGWKAKETYHVNGENEIEEIFELAPPGEAFSVYSRVKLRRQ
jgi:hypothetical protein